MVKLPKTILKSVRRYLDALEAGGVTVEAAYIFGSRARGDNRRDSDIDVGLICSGLSNDFRQETEQIWGPRRRIDLRIEPVAFRREDFRDENPLAWEIRRHGLRVR